MTTNPRGRIQIIGVGMTLIAVLLIVRLFYLGVVHASDYSDEAMKNFVSIPGNIFNRGNIFLTEKSGKLIAGATLMSGYKIIIKPALVEDKDATYEKINNIWPIDKETFMARAAKTSDPYEEVATKVTKEAGDKIKLLKLSGVTLEVDRWRFYPGANLAAQTLGFVGYKGDVLAGRYGIERQYDDVLSRTKDELYVNFFAEVFSNIGKGLFDDEAVEGDIITTIEPTVEKHLESELKGVMDKWSADAAGGIIINPRDGSIYAMAATPDFNINEFNKVDDPKMFSNPLVEEVHEYGSVIKPLVMAAGIDKGVVNAATTYEDKGSLTYNNKTIYDFDKKPHGVVSMQEVLGQSLNLGMVFVGQKLGKENFKNYMLDYGIGEKTGIDLPNEATGITSNLNSNRDIEFATATYGQGIALTPIEAARAFSALANGGKLESPHIADRIIDQTGNETKIEWPDDGAQVIKKESADEITRMLVKVVDKSLLDGTVALEHYSVAAKTGTAQIPDHKNGGYYENEYLHSFFGYFPAYDPKFLIFLYVVNPKGVNYASHTLTYPFIDTAKFLLSYYQVPPDR